MTMNRLWLAWTILLSTGAALAQPGRYVIPSDKYQITDAERAACQADAVMFCSTAYPDEEALITCMKTVRPRLTQGCRTVFEAGLRRRHIPF